MKKILQLYPLIFLSILTTTKRVEAQLQPAVGSTVESSPEVETTKAFDSYKNTFDSLVLEDRHRNIIKLGEVLIKDNDPEVSQLPITYLINAYYQIGNKQRSQELLTQKSEKLNYKELIELLSSDDIALIRYFEIEANREPIIRKAIQDYKKTETATNKEAGEQIIRFYINDQSVRKTKYAYKKDDQVAQDKRFRDFRLKDSLQNANIYAFYKKNNKYFNGKEVSEFVSWCQPLILSHYDNINLRQTFFKELLERAVKEDRMEKTNYVHFLLRTESFTDPDFFKNLEKRMQEVRKEYDLPDYLWNPF